MLSSALCLSYGYNYCYHWLDLAAGATRTGLVWSVRMDRLVRLVRLVRIDILVRMDRLIRIYRLVGLVRLNRIIVLVTPINIIDWLECKDLLD